MQFGFTLKQPENSTDLLYLLRLCQYENEHRVRKLNMKGYAESKSLELSGGQSLLSFKEEKTHPDVPAFIEQNNLVDL